MSAVEYTRCDGEGCGRVTPVEPDGIYHEAGWARVTIWGGSPLREAMRGPGVRGGDAKWTLTRR